MVSRVITELRGGGYLECDCRRLAVLRPLPQRRLALPLGSRGVRIGWGGCYGRAWLPQPVAHMHPEFDLAPDLIHLNHAGVSPWPRRAAAAVTRFATENAAQGSLDYPRWLATEQSLRARLADLIGAPSPVDIALAKSTSEGLSVVAYGLDWRPGNNVVGIAQEFPSNRVLWKSLASMGVEYRQLDLDACLAARRDPEADLLALCDHRTRLVAVSWVQYARGLRLDLERLSAGCKARGILLGIDAIQGLGALPFDLSRTPADFVVADGHKWMLGPEGLALLYVAPALRPHLRLHQYGWHMLEHRGDFERKDWAPAADARRFECGSPNLLGAHGLEAALALLQEVGLPAVHVAIEARVDRLITLIDARGYELLSPRDPDRRAGIVTFRVPGIDQGRLYAELMARRVLCAQRGAGVRFSPHFYTPMEHLDRAIDLVALAAAEPA
jgi:cysteine desulfurase/selenocysteine lyase